MNELTLRQWYKIFKNDNELVEIRILDPETKRSYSGYFTDIETILREIRKYEKCNLYFTLNEIDPACYSREQHDKISTRPKSTTSDNEILARKWCLIDIDCEKPSDTNSTEEEKELAKEVVNNVYKFLKDEGFEQPIICDSANGFHLLYKQAMISNSENTETMKNFLKVLDMYFSTDKVKIDCSTFNPSRICKLYGVISRKGADTKDRPQRESKILRVPNELKVTPNKLFLKVASYLPKPEKKDRTSNFYSETFDLDVFLEKYGIAVRNTVQTSEYTKYILEECPFNSAHRAPDSAVFKMRDGSFGFKCLHNSDRDYTFRDFRLKFDPQAYDKPQYEQRDFRQPYISERKKYKIQAENPELGPKWMSLSDVKGVNLSETKTIKTGFRELDRKILGLNLGEVTLLSGSNSAGKSSWLNTLMLNVINNGDKVALWSGELPPDKLKMWIHNAAAGRENIIEKRRGDFTIYETKYQASEKIDQWLDGKLFLYNNEYSAKWEQILNDINELLKLGVSLFILDNLFSMDIDIFDGDKNNKQKELILQICQLAKKNKIHIILVAHPRKAVGFLRKSDISGTADLTNAVDNVFICHRVNNDFMKTGGEFLGATKIQEYASFGNCIEVCKNRMFGVVDYLVGMFYEIETRRFKSSESEHIVYGWQETPVQQSFIVPDQSFVPSTNADPLPWESEQPVFRADYEDDDSCPF